MDIFLQNVGGSLRTASAKLLWNEVVSMDFWEWTKVYNVHPKAL